MIKRYRRWFEISPNTNMYNRYRYGRYDQNGTTNNCRYCRF